MSNKLIKEYNSPQFLADLARVRDVMVLMPQSGIYLRVTKQELRLEAMTTTIHYYITDQVFRVVRDVMVIM